MPEIVRYLTDAMIAGSALLLIAFIFSRNPNDSERPQS
jgi:hypothetical protein